MPEAVKSEDARWSYPPQTTLQALRRRAGWTQVDLAKKVGLDQSEISRFERYERTPTDALSRLWNAFVEAIPWELDGLEPLDLMLPWEEVVTRRKKVDKTTPDLS